MSWLRRLLEMAEPLTQRFRFFPASFVVVIVFGFHSPHLDRFLDLKYVPFFSNHLPDLDGP